MNNEYAIATRNGRFCAHQYISFLMHRNDSVEIMRRLRSGEKFDIGGAVRISFGLFNTMEEVDEVIYALSQIALGKWKDNYETYTPAFDCHNIELSSS